ncbi:MAG: BrnT family toxin [Sideroxydans sp.]|nr:BrnT family toxin [Sideroxydans sp.]
MRITYDPAKDIINQAKHGLSLAESTAFEWEEAVIWADERYEYGEARQSAIGYIGLRLHVAIFVIRGEARRVISLRKANYKEVKRYAET